MPDLGVRTMFTARDNVTRALKNMDKGVTRFGSNASRAFRSASREGSHFGKIVKGILAAGIIRRGFSALTRSVRSGTEEFIAFDAAITSAVAKFQEIDLATRKGQASFDFLKTSARDMGETTQFTAAQSAQALDELALGGFKHKQAIAALAPVVDLATAADIELGRAAKIVTKTLGSFNLRVEDTIQLQKNLTRITDLLAFTMTTSTTDIETLFAAIAKGGKTFLTSGQNIETLMATFGVLADSAIDAGEAGTVMRNFVLRLANPSAEAAAALDFLGVTVADSLGDYRDMTDIIDDLNKGLEDLGTRDRARALDIIFGKKAISGANTVLEQGGQAIRDYRDAQIAATGANKEMADIMRTSLGNQLKATKSAFIELQFKVLEVFEKKGREAILTLTKALRTFDPAPIIDGLVGIGDALGKLHEVFKFLKPIMPVLTLGLVTYVAAFKVAALWKFVTVLRAAYVAGGILNAVLLMNPYALVIGGAVAFTSALRLMLANWEKLPQSVRVGIDTMVFLFKDWGEQWMGTWRTVKKEFNVSIAAIGIMFDELWGALPKSMDGAMASLKRGFFSTIDTILSRVARVIKAILGLARTVGVAAGVDVSGVDAALGKLAFLQASVKAGAILTTPPTDKKPREFFNAPNKAEAERLRQQVISFNGRLEIAGAPPGSKLEGTTTGAPAIKLELAGQNP